MDNYKKKIKKGNLPNLLIHLLYHGKVNKMKIHFDFINTLAFIFSLILTNID